MKKFIIATVALAALVSCQSLIEEWQPVIPTPYEDGKSFSPVNMDAEVNATIAELKALYTKHGTPVEILDDLIIKGEITTSDEAGNVYRELYIQDATGAICLKLGRSSSYDDFKLGQILYVKCKGFVVGEYGYKSVSQYGGGAGLLQLGLLGDGWEDYMDGLTDKEPEYETSYIDLTPIIKNHIFRGAILPEAQRVKPSSFTGAQLTAMQSDTQSPIVSMLTKLEGLSYGNSVGGKEIFCLFYPDPNLNHSKYEPWNRVFLSSPNNRVNGADYSFGITTWALTKHRFQKLAESGIWDEVEIGDGSGVVGSAYTSFDNFGYEDLYKDVILAHPGAQSVSHYFMYDGVEVQVRTSGYARFADVAIPEDVLDGTKKIDVVGILSRYQGSPQFTILDVYYSGTNDSIIK